MNVSGQIEYLILKLSTPIIARYIREYHVLSLVGPRQSGKSTLARKLFPKHEYISLENLDLRRQADEDPRGFYEDY